MEARSSDENGVKNDASNELVHNWLPGPNSVVT